ncbi:bifunctional molybdenum cofactor biosynthesis protein MoaC/MoaB [Amnibacterium flavum]|uniref:Cyclic pyranopterin monophosphate synthase n=1 Tax=Amnibacterium flavum TaxID=2173173 RepID=A0A2V1HXL6_9MICO|nr:bifunctional molybdenum cofactor biosynthesis protein MoaC/MoaB [Amnibacterium flavum]PVZ96060.1 bifunctional molybdenum cofactor biosynthesis protein MoaC/MoaB [Amnibacterium flavum]
MNELTHVDSDGRARMIDVGGKEVTQRVATAGGTLVTTAEVVDLLLRDALKKADALATARIAGIAGAKRTSDLIPLCHPLPLDSVSIDLVPAGDSVTITATASTSGRTGVEMEALTAVTIAGLTLHDMVKAVDPAATLTDVRLLEKTGGKRGHWTRENHQADQVAAPSLRPGTAAVVVASTRAAAGTREDTTGPLIADWLDARGLTIDEVAVVADADIADTLRRIVASRPAIVVTTGGTGPSPTDATPEATAPLLDRELPGLADAIRNAGSAIPTSALSRGVAGLARGTVVVNLPGSPGGVRDGLGVLSGVLEHLLAQVSGGGDHSIEAPIHDSAPAGGPAPHDHGSHANGESHRHGHKHGGTE